MTRARIKLDHTGVSEIARVMCRDMVSAAAEQIAHNVDAQRRVAAGGWARFDIPAELTATVTHDVTDRARSRVTVAHPAALAFEAKYGMLTRAAAEAGIEVRGR